MQLHDQLLFKPHQELSALVASGAPVHVFVNPVEYHGPHLSLGNDRIISERLSRKLHERLSLSHGDMPYLVGGVIDFGCDPTPGIGSVGLTYTRLRDLILSVVDGLIALKVKRVIFHTFHGSPFHCHAIHAGIARLEAAGIKAVSVFDQVLRAIAEFDPAMFTPLRNCMANEADYTTILARLSTDFHAGFFETSVAIHLAPETVANDYTQLPPCPALPKQAAVQQLAKAFTRAPALNKELNHLAHALGWMEMKPFLGYTSYPSLANPKAGAWFVNEMILPLYEQVCRDVLWGASKSPKAQFAWMKPLAPLIGGRV